MRFVLPLLFMLSCSGCMTLATKFPQQKQEPPPSGLGHLYSGTWQHLANADCFVEAFPASLVLFNIGIPLSVIDFPLSLVADTLFLPADLLAEPAAPRPAMGCHFHI